MTWSNDNSQQRAPTAPKYDTPLARLLHNEPQLLETCTRAGFVLIRDAAKPTFVELVASHGFTERQAEDLHHAFAGSTEYEFPIEHGDGFTRLVKFHMRDFEGGEGNQDRAWERLGELGAQPEKPLRRRRLHHTDM